MSERIRLWNVSPSGTLHEVPEASLNVEARLEDWLVQDISLLDPRLLVIGRQVQTDHGGKIDLLSMDASGDLVIVELKRDRTPREVTAQILDYASWVKDLTNERIMEIADAFLGPDRLEDAFSQHFGIPLPDTLNEDHRMLLVGARIDAASTRIVKYLAETYGVNINAVTFQYFRSTDGSEFLGRVFLIEPSEVDLQSRTKRASKRCPNLSYEELEAIADEREIGDLYRLAVEHIGRFLRKHTTRSSIGFTAVLEGHRKTIISLMPPHSSGTDGLRFRVYINRLQKLLNRPQEELPAMLPRRRKSWIYYEGAGPDYEGFEGFFSDRTEILRLAAALAEMNNTQPEEQASGP